MSIRYSWILSPVSKYSLLYLVVLVAALALSSCSKKTEYLPRESISRVEVHKSERRMELYKGNKLVRAYDISLGNTPVGHKIRQGDGKTPVGKYVIDRRNPRSRFYLSLGISYPNERDKRVAALLGVDPGGDIFIHGQPNGAKRTRRDDWTEGCVAVSNADMREIYRLVGTGTPVHLYN